MIVVVTKVYFVDFLRSRSHSVLIVAYVVVVKYNMMWKRFEISDIIRKVCAENNMM